MSMQKQWSTPYLGVSHYGEIADGYWATVSDYGSFVLLSKWYPGCAFSPIVEEYNDLNVAKMVGESWALQEKLHRI